MLLHSDLIAQTPTLNPLYKRLNMRIACLALGIKVGFQKTNKNYAPPRTATQWSMESRDCIVCIGK